MPTTTIERLPSGDRGTSYALAHMASSVRKDVADPQLRQFTESLVAEVQPHDFRGEIEKVFNYVQSIPYRRHPVDVQRALDAKSAINSSNLDCVSKSVLLATLLGTLGYLSRFAIIRQGGADYDHVYVETQINGQINGQWLPLDPTPDALSGGAQSPGWEVTGVDKSYYPIWPGSAPLLGATSPVAGAAMMGAQDIFGLIMNIWSAHSAKVYAEDEISGAWEALGRPIIQQIKDSFDSGAITVTEASQALDALYHQFLVAAQPISKYKGHFGFIPKVNEPRPSSDCNWACGTSWDLHWELDALKKEMAESGPAAWQVAGYTSKSAWKAAGKPTAPIVTVGGSMPTSSGTSIPKEYLIGGALLVAVILLAK